MKKYKKALLPIILTLILVLTLIFVFRSPSVEEGENVTAPQPTPTPSPTSLEALYSTLSQDYLAIQLEYNEAVAAQVNLQNQLALLQSQYQQTQSDFTFQLQQKDSEYALLMGKLSTTQQDFQRFKDTIGSADTVREEAYNALTDRLDALANQLDQIGEKYPPKEFPTLDKYQEWRDSVGDLSSYPSQTSQARVLQQKGLEAGWIVNFTPQENPTVIINGTVYWVNPKDPSFTPIRQGGYNG